jgi:hypothetical protein
MPIEHKRGDTLDWSGVITDAGSLAGSGFAGSTLKCQGRDSQDVLVCDFNIQWLDTTTGAYRIWKPAADTAIWKVGQVIYFDIQVTFSNGDVSSTSTECIKVTKDITQ